MNRTARARPSGRLTRSGVYSSVLRGLIVSKMRRETKLGKLATGFPGIL